MPPRQLPYARLARTAIQLGIVALIAYLSLRHQLFGRAAAAPIDSYCPFGAIETLPALAGGFGLIRRVGTSNLVLMGTVVVMTLGLGATFCGWLCPFGSVQDWLAALGRRLFGRTYVVPAGVHRYLKQARWLVLALIVWMSWRALGLWFAEYDPYRALFHFSFESTLAVVLIAITVLGSIAVERWWCLYLCPLGAIVGALATVGLVKVRRGDACVDCGICTAKCPMRVPVDSVAVVSDQHCTMCTECVEACPEPGALVLSTGAKDESLPPVGIGVATVMLFFAMIGASMALGWWQTGQGCGG